jgi:hypothetical protein
MIGVKSFPFFLLPFLFTDLGLGAFAVVFFLFFIGYIHSTWFLNRELRGNSSRKNVQEALHGVWLR